MENIVKQYIRKYKSETKILPYTDYGKEVNIYDYVFIPYPAHSNKKLVTISCFDTEDEIDNFLLDETPDDCVCFVSRYGVVTDCSNHGHKWNIRGYINRYIDIFNF